MFGTCVSRTVRRIARGGAAISAAMVMLFVPGMASAAPAGPATVAVKSLPQVVSGLQHWVMGLLAGLATLFLVLAGVYWATAGGDPAQVDKAKNALKNALVGYGLAVLAPVLLTVVQGIVGG